MSWQDTYNQRMIITLTKKVGSEKQSKDFPVLTRPAYEKDVEWNATEYSFVNIDGVLVKKRKLLKREFNVDFYFVGAENVTEAEDFESWCMSEFPWLITHPYYGSILCQIVKLKFDSKQLNVTQITGTAVETIDEETSAFISKDPRKRVNNSVAQIDEIYLTPLYRSKFNPTINDKEVLKQEANKYYTAFSKITDIVEEANEYQNELREFYTDIDQVGELVSFSLQSLNSFLTFPFTFTASIKDKFRVIGTQFAKLRTTILGYTTPSQKTSYEVQGVGFLQAACLSALNPIETDYLISTSALRTINDIKTFKEQFDSDISQLQSPNGSNPSFYVPNQQLITAIDVMVNVTISNLYTVALGGQKEYEVVTDKDTNVVLLAHRYYGLANDENIERIITTNGLTYQQVSLGVMKGTKIVYYR